MKKFVYIKDAEGYVKKITKSELTDDYTVISEEEYLKISGMSNYSKVFICWQNDGSILGIATTEENARKMCTESEDAYLAIEPNVAKRESINTTKLCMYNVDGSFLNYSEYRKKRYGTCKTHNKDNTVED